MYIYIVVSSVKCGNIAEKAAFGVYNVLKRGGKVSNGDILSAKADKIGIPLRTLVDVKADLVNAKRMEADSALARLMLRYGRLTPEAWEYVIAYADHIWQCEAYGIKRTD